MNRATLGKILAAAFGMCMAVLIAEIGLRAVFGSLSPNLQIALRDVRRHPFTDERLAPPPLWSADSRYQTIVRPGAVDSLQAGSPTVLFKVTSYAWWGRHIGFRSPPPTDGTTQVVAVGDSHTFCFTELADCWTSQLSGLLGKRVDNLGQPVTGSTSHARIYEDFIANLKSAGLQQPETVIWQFYGNDYNDDYGLYALENGIVPTGSDTPSAAPDNSWFADNSALYALISAVTRPSQAGVEQFIDPYTRTQGRVTIHFGQTYLRDAFDMSAERNLTGESFTHDAILKTRDTVAGNGGRFIILLIPTKEEVYAALTEPDLGAARLEVLREPTDRMLQFCAAQNLNCIDALPVLQAAIRQYPDVLFYFPTDPHLTSAGNEIIARTLADALSVDPQ